MRVIESLQDAAAIARRTLEIKRRTRWSRVAIDRFSAERVCAIVDNARERSPFYRERLPAGTARLEDLPILHKDDVLEHFDALVTDRGVHLADVERFLLGPDRRGDERYFRGRYAALLSGGSSGRRAALLHDREMSRINYAHALARMPSPAVNPPVRLVTVCSSDIRHVTGYYATFLPPQMMPTQLIPADTELFTLARQLEAIDPHAITTYPWTAMLLLELSRSGQLRFPHLAVMWVSGEPLTPQMRQKLEQGFGCPVRQVYGTTEAGLLAIECAHGRMHVAEDIIKLEVVDTDNRRVAGGDLGDRALVTHLWNEILPLIRYRFDDRVRMGVGPCECGSQHRWIAEIVGRSDSAFLAEGRSGRRVSVMGAKLHLNLLTTVSDLVGVQLVLDDVGLEVSALLREGADAERTLDAVRTELSRSLLALDVDLDQLPVRVTRVGHLACLPGSGKSFAFRSTRARLPEMSSDHARPASRRKHDSVEVRVTAEADDGALLRLFDRVSQPMPPLFVKVQFREPPTIGIGLRWQGAKIFAAEAPDGTLIGAAWVVPHRVSTDGVSRPAAYLGGLLVETHHRRQGLAKKLTEARLEYARSVFGEKPLTYTYIVPTNTASFANAAKWGVRCKSEVSVVGVAPRFSPTLLSKLRVRRANRADVTNILEGTSVHFDQFRIAPALGPESLLASIEGRAGVRGYYVVEDAGGLIVAGAEVIIESLAMEYRMSGGDRDGWFGGVLGASESLLPKIRRVILEGAWYDRASPKALRELCWALRRDLGGAGTLCLHVDPRSPVDAIVRSAPLGRTRLSIVSSHPEVIDGERPVELLTM